MTLHSLRFPAQLHRFMKLVGQFFSYLLHPIAMPAIALLLAANFDPYLVYFMPGEVFDPIFYVILANTFLLPALSVWFLKSRNLIGSIELKERADRFLPFLITLIFYLMTYFLLRQVPIPESIFSLLFGAVCALFLALLINFALKISVHMVGICGVIGAMVGLFSLHGFSSIGLLMVLVVLAGILGSSRMVLGSHQPWEVYAGALVGFFTEYLIVSNGFYL